MRIRTRFAPSPTGFLHIGGVRTALFSWLYARRHGGEFILRLEDTDQARSTDESARAILEGLAWLGLDHDGEVPRQTERLERYRKVAQSLLERGHAYHCHCSPERLAGLREAQIAAGETPRYDGLCRDRSGGAQERPECSDPVVRFMRPLEGELTFVDRVHGEVRVSNEILDDLILIRSDGLPTYNFSATIDDMDMGVTHIIRGDDHLSNTPKQILLRRAIEGEDFESPEFAHIPMILGADGKRLSKRTGAAGLHEYMDAGYLPEALLNYLVRLGWSHGDREVFSRDDMIELFDLEHVSKAAAALNPQKLDWLNRHHLNEKSFDELRALLKDRFAADGMNEAPSDAMLEALLERCDTLQSMTEGARFFYIAPEYPDDELNKRVDGARLAEIAAALSALDESAWNEAEIKQALEALAEKLKVKFGAVGAPLRYVLTGGAPSPGIAVTAQLVGRSESLARVETALKRLRGTAS